ncbi:hypothetical protein BGY98DRAFT_199323 [Russula aff. rugulosa BPL654]|nr:hypothetical protein BGY98DRAFT_199323 [Russula aff. rugulosa BPL654]
MDPNTFPPNNPYRAPSPINRSFIPNLNLPGSPFPLNDPSSEGHYDDTHHDTPLQTCYAAGWAGTNSQNVQEVRLDHLEAQGSSCPSDPPGSSRTNAGTSSSLFGALCSQPVAHDDFPHVTLSHEYAEVATQRTAVTQGQSATTQAAQRRRQKAQEKREKDRIRKAADRASDDQAYSRVCQLLAVKLGPKNTRSKRILKDVESIDESFERMSLGDWWSDRSMTMIFDVGLKRAKLRSLFWNSNWLDVRTTQILALAFL